MSDQTIKCPDWCTTPRDVVEEPGDHQGPSWPNVPSISGSEGVNSVSIGTGLDYEDGAYVYIEATGLCLTPEQARTAGLALLSAASWAKDHGEAAGGTTTKTHCYACEILWDADMAAMFRQTLIRAIGRDCFCHEGERCWLMAGALKGLQEASERAHSLV